MPTPMRNQAAPARRGMVLIIVLVVVVLLTLGAYTFSEFMIIEAKATAFHGRALQARAFADSGVEFVSVMLGDRASLPTIGLYHNPSVFQGHLILNSNAAGGRGRFTVIAPVEGDLSARHVRFGLIDESSKLNLNTIAALLQQQEATASANTGTSGAAGAQPNGGTNGGTSGGAGNSGSSSSNSSSSSSDTEEGLPNPLMGIPGMTLEVSEAIFDWIDADDEQRANGAENEYYQSLAPPYECKNAKLETLDELLLIRGITPQVLFGEDANRNGLLDPNENDGQLTAPFDNGDGVLDRGWSAYLTVYSRELNLQPDRTNKIDVNSNTLSDVYDKLLEEFDAERANFIVAYRLNGPVATTEPGGGNGPNTGTQGASTGSRGVAGTGSQGGGTGSRGASTGGGTGSSGASNPPQQGGQGAGQAMTAQGGQGGQGGGKVTRAGMDLTNGGKVKINTIYELIGVEVEADVNGVKTKLPSPWKDDPGTISSYMPELLDKISTHGSDQYIEGRLNINQAYKAVMLGLPSMTEDIAHRIEAAQLRGSGGEPLPEVDNSRANTSWLYQEGIVDLPTLRKLDPYITGRGDVFRMQVMGHFDDGGPMARVEAIIDATQNPPQPIFFRDLTDLGRGYTLPVMPRQ